MGSKIQERPNVQQILPPNCEGILQNYHTKITLQAAGYGIANYVDTIIPFTADTANLVLETTAELVNAVSVQNDKKLDNLIKLQTETLAKTLAAFQKLLHKNNPPITDSSRTTHQSPKTNALTASTTTQTSPLTNAGNYLPMQPHALPTGNPWRIAMPTNPLHTT
eukprot:CCRYP_012701-RA/>CCRYP_012701-RA protein AED:0.65 eAED:1.00 QI:0/-1/0/1/-1/1/1/0/164